MQVESISAITLKVADMRRSVRFYQKVLGLEIIYGGEEASFTSLRVAEDTPILNLEQGTPGLGWGRIIFYVDDVDECWRHLKAMGFDAQRPRDASWGERYFHAHDPDGHELSFAKRLP